MCIADSQKPSNQERKNRKNHSPAFLPMLILLISACLAAAGIGRASVILDACVISSVIGLTIFAGCMFLVRMGQPE